MPVGQQSYVVSNTASSWISFFVSDFEWWNEVAEHYKRATECSMKYFCQELLHFWCLWRIVEERNIRFLKSTFALSLVLWDFPRFGQWRTAIFTEYVCIGSASLLIFNNSNWRCCYLPWLSCTESLITLAFSQIEKALSTPWSTSTLLWCTSQCQSFPQRQYGTT